MIIRNYREISIVDDNNVYRDKTSGLSTELLKRFDKFHLSEHSSENLLCFFRFLERKNRIKKTVPYNFMIHSDEQSRAQEFVHILFEVMGYFNDTVKEPVIFTERQLLDVNTSDKVINAIDDADIFMLYDCLAAEEYAPYVHTGKAEAEKAERDSLWKRFLNKCEDSPKTCIIIAAPEHIIKERFRNNEHLYYRIFRNHIYLGDASSDEILDLTLKGLNDNNIQSSGDFGDALGEYINTIYKKSDLKDNAFVDDLLNRLLTQFYGKTEELEEITPDCIPFYRKDKSYDEVLKEMDNLIGLEKVKESFLEIPYMIQEEESSVIPSLHMAFIGNPGTGKTTVAELAAELFYSMGVIKKNRVISVSALDLIGGYVGETSRLTKEYCRKAYGGILFIDEAYLIAKSKNGSNNDQVKQECIGTLLQEMENNRDRLLVIFAGYPKEMESFLYDSNSGLASRLYKIIEFEDYSDEELMRIFLQFCKKDDFNVTPEAKEKIALKLTSLRYSRDFGNARTVRNIYIEAKKEMRRFNEMYNKTLEAKHIILDTDLKDYNTIKKELDEMIGVEAAKTEINRAIQTCRFSKENNSEVPFSKHMLFLGNAGTGKSTVAKLFCQLLFSVGAAKSPNCVVIAAGDLLGRSNPVESLKENCKLASGGVLFLDEAYAIQSDSRYCSAFISVLLEVMEEERENITIILAGYEKEMNQFLNKNQGLKSRFPVTILFDDFTNDQLTDIFISLCRTYDFTYQEEALKKFKQVIECEKKKENFGNARTVRNIFEQSYRLHAENYMCNPVEEEKYVFREMDIVDSAEQRMQKNPIGFVN